MAVHSIDPCATSIVSCVESLCSESQREATLESWMGRAADVLLLGNIDSGLSGRSRWNVNQIRHMTHYSEGDLLRLAKVQSGQVWANESVVGGAEGFCNSSPDAKTAYRRLVARLYLQANPDFCKPPDQLPEVATLPGRYQTAAHKADVPSATSFGRPMIAGTIFPMGETWVDDVIVAGGGAAVGAGAVWGIATAAEWLGATWYVWIWAL